MVTNGKTYFNCTLNKVIDNDTNFHFYSCFNIPKILINTFKIVRYNNLFCTDFFHAQKLFFTFFEIRLANHTCLYSVGAERGIKILRFVQGGGVNMKPTSFENAIRLQFDTLMKKVIDGIIKNYEKELDRRSNREIPFCELPKIVVNSFPVFDDYELDVTIFDVYGMEARVSGNELCKALQQLPERKRNNLLMFYFLDMSDTEIAELQHISRAGVFKNRQVALHNMKKILQELPV